MAKIETGVDKLVELVASRKKISIDDAAKELGVSKTVVQEWAEFLEEEGLIGVEYSLSKTYLVEKKLSKSDVQRKEGEYEQKKEAFVRKVDTALRQLEKETSGFEDIKKQYNLLKGDIGDEIDQVKHELDELKHYETLKQSIDQDIIQQKVDYQKMVDDVHKKLYIEEKRYEKVLGEIHEETEHVAKEKESLHEIQKQEESLKERLLALKSVIGQIDQEVGTINRSIAEEEGRLARLRDVAATIEKDLRRKKEEELEPLIKASKEHGDKILQVQESIIKKVQARKDTMTTYEREGEGIINKFDQFFKKRMETERILSELERQKAELGHELEGLKQKAIAFNLVSGKTDVKKHVGELEKQYGEFQHKKGAFAQQLEKLRHVVSGE